MVFEKIICRVPSLDMKKPPVIAVVPSEARDLFMRTLEVYSTRKFAEMYFEKWQNDIPDSQLRAFSASVGIGKKVLDAGCGPGHHTNYLHALGHPAVGIDLSEESLKLARAHFDGPQFLRADMLRTPFGDSEFVGIWACASLMHLPEALLPSQLLEFHRLLCPEGVLAVTVTVEAESHVDAFGRYFQAYSKKQLFQRLHQAGFNVEGRDERLRGKATEPAVMRTEWITITARRKRQNHEQSHPSI